MRIVTQRSAETGDAVQYVMTFPLEFRRAQTHYPIFFQKDPNTGRFFPIILLGFEQGENLFLGPEGWEPPYVPMSILRGPFLIGFQENADHPDGRQAVITIDMDSPLITSAEDVLQALEPLAERPMQSGYSLDESRQLTLPVTSDDTNRNQLLNSMGYTPVTIDDLIRHTHLSADLVQLLLLELDLAGKIERHGGNLVSRI